MAKYSGQTAIPSGNCRGPEDAHYNCWASAPHAAVITETMLYI